MIDSQYLHLRVGLADEPSVIARALKRASDVIAAVALMTIGLPLFLLVAAAILLEDGGPIFYSQLRVGRNGRLFRIRKFRSMCRDAEASTGPIWSTPDDPRVTRVGRWIRVTRLDELPQAWNLLRGDMSLVGPRPERPELEERLRAAIPEYDQRHALRPGLTGWAQVNVPLSANLEIARRKIACDLHYVHHASLAFDLYILARSVAILFRECRWFLADS